MTVSFNGDTVQFPARAARRGMHGFEVEKEIPKFVEMNVVIISKLSYMTSVVCNMMDSVLPNHRVSAPRGSLVTLTSVVTVIVSVLKAAHLGHTSFNVTCAVEHRTVTARGKNQLPYNRSSDRSLHRTFKPSSVTRQTQVVLKSFTEYIIAP